MNREQMIAWLTLEGWVPHIDREHNPGSTYYELHRGSECIIKYVVDQCNSDGAFRDYFEYEISFRGSKGAVCKWEDWPDIIVNEAFDCTVEAES